ncbi:DNA-binding transcriptional regulator, FadR family [Prauserella aidingensis]|uniref:FadR/GntR family transcriptional regulator n=1 Tax=Prauserella aidingensis TaxID=387890 RepID=UPI0020A34808|nr:FCD domain-containing protein [Prauserella aidingensis]MCP2256000.1 DNA-binding transcriptional regulator, FadR family [Prauserella aidingensis]
MTDREQGLAASVSAGPASRRALRESDPATMPERAAEQLAALAAAAEPGARLGTKEELRTYCGVSVGTFNEALRLVQARGVVTVRAGRVGGLFASRQSPLVRLGNAVLALDVDAASVVDALRLRDALDPLLVEDALHHASADDLDAMRQELDRMRRAATDLDGIEFIHANWALHARIADVTPNAMLRSFYLSLLEIIESHTLSVQPADERPVSQYVQSRYQLHADLVEAIAIRDKSRAVGLIRQHNMAASTTEPTQGPSETLDADGAFHSPQTPGAATGG